MRDVVSDTGPLISFERIPDGSAMLRRIVRMVLIPPDVLAELQFGLAPSTESSVKNAEAGAVPGFGAISK